MTDSVDISTFVDGDLSPTFDLVSKERAIAESVLRLWTTERGTLVTDLAAGENVTHWLSDEIDTSEGRLHALEAALAFEALRDERVEDIDVLVTVDRPAEKLTIKGVILPADGSTAFEFVFALSAASVAVLVPT